MKMQKNISIAPWSLVLSLCLAPLSPAYGQEDGATESGSELSEDGSTEGQPSNSGEEVMESSPAEGDATDIVDTKSVVDPDGQENSVDVEAKQDEPSSTSSSFDPRYQLASTDGLRPPTVQDIAAFKQAYKRYRQRINDFRQETLSMVEIQRQEAFDLLREQYTEPLSLLEEQQIQQRNTAVERFERFISKYPESPEGAGIRFQLADIYFKMAEEAFIVAQEELAMKMDENPDYEADIRKDLDRAFALYKDIVELFPESDVVDGALYMMAWCYSDAESDLYDADLAATFYKRVITEFPESRFVAQSNYFVGQYYFNQNDNETALTYFDAATKLSKPDVGEFNSLYEYANYRLAWTHYLLNQYDEALALFTAHQDYSERKEKETGSPTNTLEESFEYTALSFADIAENENSQAVIVADEYYKEIGTREYTAEVFVYLAKELIEQVRILEAVDTYKYLQDKWPAAPDNPKYQKQLAELYLNEGEVDLYMEEMKILTDRYAENGEWWVQNRNNPEAQDVARAYIEESLLDVAYNQYGKAKESQDPQDYMEAISSFDRFLNRFPFADEYYDVMWYMADAYIEAGEIVKSLEQYRELVKTAPDHQRGELSQLKILNIVNQRAYNKLMGNFEQLPADAVVKNTLELENGDVIEVYELADELVEFIQAYKDSATLDYDRRRTQIEKEIAAIEREDVDVANAERVVSSLQTIIQEVDGAQAFFDSSLKQYQYNIGQIYLGHRQYDLARQYFNLVIDGYPQSMEAMYASNLIIASYQKELNWTKVQEEARRFIGLALGPDGEVPEDFAKYEQNATLQLLLNQQRDAQKMMAAGDVEGATRQFNLTADGLLAYLNDYENIEQNDYSNLLLLSGNIYEEGGNIEKANAVYRDFVERFPGNKASRSILFSIATNHQNALELEEAIKYFDILYNQTYGKGIEYEDAKAALYNSAFLKIGLEQYKEAAEGLEKYATKFPEQPDAEMAFFMAGAQWEKVARWRALDFYTRYLKRYNGEDPDHTMMAHYRRIELYEESKKSKKREIEREWKQLLSSFTAMQADGKDSPKMRQYAAEYYLRDIPEKMEAFKSVKYSRDDKRNADLIKSQLAELDTLRNFCTKPGEDFQDFEAIVAGRYCSGSAELHLAQFFEAFPIPENLVPGDEEANYRAQVVFEEQLASIWVPLREGAITTLEQTLALSEKQGRWTKWTQLALEDLTAIDPKAYPPQKQEVVYPISSVFVPTAGPISLDSPNGSKAPSIEKATDGLDDGQSPNNEAVDQNLGEQEPVEEAVKEEEILSPEMAPDETSSEEPSESDMGWGTPNESGSEAENPDESENDSSTDEEAEEGEQQ